MSLKNLPQRLELGMGGVAARFHRHPFLALAIAALLTGLGVFGARHLTLNADLVSLLPRSFESVQDIDKLRQRFGGMGYVVVVGQGAAPEQLQQFAEDLAPRLAALPDVRFVDYKRASGFFADRALYYLEPEDLKAVETRIDDRIHYELLARNPLFVQLDDEPAPPLDFTDIQQKYGGSAQSRLSGKGETYYLDRENRVIVLLVKPKGTSADLGYAKQVVTKVDAFLKAQDLSKYGPGFSTAITGTYKKKVDQQKEITGDLARASTIASVLLLLYLCFHFRSALAVLFTLVPVGAALAWTYGFVGVAYGQVNLLTGFLGAILGGLGVEHGIHLYGRYTALRTEGILAEDATREAFQHTGFSALISAMVAALTFLSLAISEFKAFREFGVIAAVGMVVAVAAYVLILPALLGLAARAGWKPRGGRGHEGANSEIARWLPRLYRPVTLVMGLLVLGLGVAAAKVRFNYDFSALDDVSLESVKLDKKVDPILGYSQTPVIVLTDTPKQEREVVARLQERKRQQGKDSAIDFVAALEDLVPQGQQEKQQILQRIRAQLQKVDPATLDPAARRSYEQALRSTGAEPFTRADIPASVRRQFEGSGGEASGFVLVFARVSLSDGAGVQKFAHEVRGLELSDGSRISAAGEAFVLADILHMVTSEAPAVLLAALLSVLLAMWLTMGRLQTALFCLMPTLLSILALVGLMALLDMPFNYLNIVVIPVLIGTTVDAGVHLVSRLTEEDTGDFPAVYGETGRAIVGGLLTSAVGFGALILAHHPGLNSVGELAILGFAVNLLIILLGFPAFLLLMQRRKKGLARVVPMEHCPRDVKHAGDEGLAEGEG
ncbi:MMPL family transporter [Aggregicoccus sp. 17bor-14]|uniref:efflux RND transporter permease subunit n=1 Tax=Myxococcaceae TaxID=31 RepID=UPI00129CFCD6|nr:MULTISPECIES: MMPL family transporter [Myxococcaceae]MBF5043301.1 MMPL family transporter [Simulacricoccus sp. 17bor-14]MRI89060.1 MMPL family transporter [Aggregicoccus sp. 17bor-14]